MSRLFYYMYNTVEWLSRMSASGQIQRQVAAAPSRSPSFARLSHGRLDQLLLWNAAHWNFPHEAHEIHRSSKWYKSKYILYSFLRKNFLVLIELAYLLLGLNAGKYSATGSSSPTFQALFHYFADPVCSNATLTVLATGHYSPGSDSDRVQGATEFDFFVQSVIITVHDESTARNLNGLKVQPATI